jgi:hypothetical protein
LKCFWEESYKTVDISEEGGYNTNYPRRRPEGQMLLEKKGGGF